MQQKRSSKPTGTVGTKVDLNLLHSFRAKCKQLRFSQKDVLEALLHSFIDYLSTSGQTDLVRAGILREEFETFLQERGATKSS